MSEFRLHPNMLIGVETASSRGPEGGEPWRKELGLLRRMGVQTCLIDVRWREIEPEADKYDLSALNSLREEIIQLQSREIEPVLCLYRFCDPDWFLERGGWEKEDNLRCYLRYVGRVLRAVGHLVSEYITLSDANAYAWEGGGAPGGRRSFWKSALVMSHMACVHIRAYRLIHDTRKRLGFSDTAVGFSLRLWGDGRTGRLLPRREGGPDPLYQTVPLRAMARGEFLPPLRNVLRVQPGEWCDFVGVSFGPVSGSGHPLRKRDEDDAGRTFLSADSLAGGLGALLRTVAKPVYVLDRGACDWEDAFRAKYIFENLRALTLSHQPVLRYYYRSLLDGPEQCAGVLARCGLAYTDAVTGRVVTKASGEFFAALVRERGADEALYQKYVAGQEYKR